MPWVLQVPPSVQAAKFVWEADLHDDKMFEFQVVLRKEGFGEHGLLVNCKNYAMATAFLSETFWVAKHKIISRAQEGDQPKSRHIQQVIVSMLHWVKEGIVHSKLMDSMEICTMPCMKGILNGIKPVDWWDLTQIILWSEWEKTDERQFCGWQQCITKCFSSRNCTASKWPKEFASNSSNNTLRMAVTKWYNKLSHTQQGGIIYHYYTLCQMFQMSREMKEAMLIFCDIFKKKGVTCYLVEMCSWLWRSCLVFAGIWMPLELYLMNMW